MAPNQDNEEPPKCKNFKCEDNPKSQAECEKVECKAEQSPFQKMLSGLKKEFQFPAFIRTWGPGRTNALKQYLPGLAIYGAGSLIALIYFSEWKTVLRYMPYYRGKYADLYQADPNVVAKPPEKVTKKPDDAPEEVAEDGDKP